MNILVVNYEYPPIGGGAAYASRHLAEEMARAGHTVVALTSAFGNLRGAAMEHGVEVVRRPVGRARVDRSNMREMATYMASASWGLGGLLKSRAIDVALVFFSIPCGPLGLLGRLGWGVPYVVSLRGSDVPGCDPQLARFHTLLTPLRRCVLRNAAAVTAPSLGLQKKSEAADPVPVEVIVNAVDSLYFQPPDEATRSAAGEGGPLRILYVGRFRSEKNPGLLLEAASRFAADGARRFELHMVGDGPMGPALRAQAQALGLAERVIWWGWMEKHALRDLYLRMDCLVNPSLFEGMPNAVLEAMACALPVAASRVSGNEDVVQHGETGLLFESGDSAGLADALAQLDADRPAARRMGDAGRRWVEERYSWPAMAGKYLALLERVVGR